MSRLIVPTGYRMVVPKAFDPLDYFGSDLYGWYDAQDSDTITEVSDEITVWADKSSQANDLTPVSTYTGFDYQTSRIGGLSCARILTNNRMSGGSPWGATADTICVAAITRENISSDNFLLSLNGSSSTSTTRVSSHMPYGGNRGWYWDINSITEGSGRESIPSSVTVGNSVISVVYWSSSSDQWIYLQSAGVGKSTSGNGLNSSATVSGGVYLGLNVTDHDLGEMIILNKYPTDEEVLLLQGYLAHKWNRLDDLETGHKYKRAYPVV